jgi:hypothetical protein
VHLARLRRGLSHALDHADEAERDGGDERAPRPLPVRRAEVILVPVAERVTIDHPDGRLLSSLMGSHGGGADGGGHHVDILPGSAVIASSSANVIPGRSVGTLADQPTTVLGSRSPIRDSKPIAMSS